jgi:L-arabinonolactonase
VANVGEFVRFGPGDGLPDGSVIDEEGCMWNAAWGVGRVRRYSPHGRLIHEVHVPARNTTCPAFGGETRGDLFVTSSRQEMTTEDLARVPHAGGVYRAANIGVRGVADALFEGL